MATLERAGPRDRDSFLAEWRDLGCELPVSLQLLQEGVKRGRPEDVDARLQTIDSLGPLRGAPSGSAGVMVHEATHQIGTLLELPVPDLIAWGRSYLLAPLSIEEVAATFIDDGSTLAGFNTTGAMSAEFQRLADVFDPSWPGQRVSVSELEAHVKAIADELAPGMPPALAEHFRATGAEVVKTVAEAGGDLWAARLRRWGLDDLECLPDLRPEDYDKASVFVTLARGFSQSIAARIPPSTPEQVRALASSLRPYAAPGTSLEMAVRRARRAHSKDPSASDVVDEEHVTFAPYVDLIFVDKRTLGFLTTELRRKDGRVPTGLGANVVRASAGLDDVMEKIRARGRASR